MKGCRMMGELIFTFCFGGSLILMGFITHLLLNRMEHKEKSQKVQKQTEKVV